MTTKFFGLTGGIGSGKSTVAAIFAKLGVPILDLDQLGKDILNKEPLLLKQLVQTFGTSILNHDKSLNRSILAQKAFKNKGNTNKLNEIMHPVIKKHEYLWRKQQKEPLALIEASVLIESGGVKRMDGLIVILSDLETRKQRVLKRGNQDLNIFNSIVLRQCSDTERTQQADFVISNNSDMRSLQLKVQSIFSQIADHHDINIV